MNIKENPLFSRLLGHGWVANIVIGVLMAAFSQLSLLGIVLAGGAMLVLLATTGRMEVGEKARSMLSRSETRIGVGLAALLVISSIYVLVRPGLKNDVPGRLVELMVTQARADIGEKSAIDLIPVFKLNGRSQPIFGYEKMTTYEIVTAKSLADRLLGDWLALLDLILGTAVGMVTLWFLAAMAIRRLAEEGGPSGGT